MGEDASVSRIREWLTNYVSTLFEMPAQDVNEEQEFARFGMDSVAIVSMSADLGEWLHCNIDPTCAYEHPTIAALSVSLAARADIQPTTT